MHYPRVAGLAVYAGAWLTANDMTINALGLRKKTLRLCSYAYVFTF